MIEGQKQYVLKHGLLFILLIVAANVFSQTDSTKKIKAPKHYFTPTIFSDYYTTPQKNLDARFTKISGDAALKKRLGSYQYSQLVGGFYFPIITRDYSHTDGSTGNFHLLGTGSYMMAMPRFGGISNHNLLKASIGVRGIYNSGKKGIWFVDITPFMSTDLSAHSNTVYRWASTVLYDYMASPSLSFRFGVTRTFILGNRLQLPYFGMRIGRLDKSYLSIQFPRNVTFSFPMSKYLRGSVYFKPMGGLFNMANNDSIYPTSKDNTIIYGRYELINGFRLDANFNRYISLFVSTGYTGVKYLAFFPEDEDKRTKFALTDFYHEKISRGLFFNIGFTLRIGKAKSIYNNYNLYETFNLNSTIDVGDNNTNTGDGNIPNAQKNKVQSNLKIKDVQDLIEAQDLY
ncbi:MAG TPA: hypothetical protein VKG26_05710 [Bacteroidia bacterium]|nr:hypothetical protein [Bacteroidia bacterium]